MDTILCTCIGLLYISNIGEGNGRSLLGESRRWNGGTTTLLCIFYYLLRSVVGSISRSTQLPRTIIIIKSSLYRATKEFRVATIMSGEEHKPPPLPYSIWLLGITTHFHSKVVTVVVWGWMVCSQICVHSIYGLSTLVRSMNVGLNDWRTDSYKGKCRHLWEF